MFIKTYFYNCSSGEQLSYFCTYIDDVNENKIIVNIKRLLNAMFFTMIMLVKSHRDSMIN